MHSWFTEKIGEIADLAHYCHYPVLEAHLRLTQGAVDDIYGQSRSDKTDLKQILSLLVTQAELNGQEEALHHLRQALHALGSQSIDAENVVTLDFSQSKPKRFQTVY